ncbi:MAG: hypothetical protein NUV97_03435 [archaeon]|nr:hypothetical protein [archaeon]
MIKDTKIIFVIILTILILIIGIIILFINQEGEQEEVKVTQDNISTINYQNYNFQFINENIQRILSSQIRNQGVAFYLPPTRYINVSKGQYFGVAFALNNPNPSGENYFVYEFTADKNTCANESWIKMGKNSFGKIPEGWIDHATVFFEFPTDAPTCTAKYNFVITKDGQAYDLKQLEFNILPSA